MGAARRVAEESINHLLPRPPFDNLRYLEESVIALIQRHLKRHEFFRPWWGSPRLYALLRILDCDESALQQFQNANINDFWLPIDEVTFNRIGANIDWDRFRQTQRYILTNPEQMSEAKLLATPHLHRHLEYGEDFFEEKEHLGEGMSARVFRVQHNPWDNGKYFACKRAMRGRGRHQRDRIQLFIKELEILRRIDHPHTIRLVASYTDTLHFALILSPAADESLKTMLDSVSIPLSKEDDLVLRQSLTCLVSALTYLHEAYIRHKDIKPSNIVLSKGCVYLCDFGISNDWAGGDPTTEGPSHLTPGYCSPEVMSHEPRNDASDVWSMGRVFCDIVTVLAGKTLSDMLQGFDDDLCSIYMARGPENMDEWLSGLIFEDGEAPRDFLLSMIRRMMATDPAARPKARQILTEFLTKSQESRWLHVDKCCRDLHSNTNLTIRNNSRPTSPQNSMQLLNIHPNPMQIERENGVLRHQDVTATPPSIQVSPPQRASPAPEASQDQASSPNLSLNRQSTSTDRRTSFGESSIESQQEVNWSSGFVESSSRIAVISTSVRCNCAPRIDIFDQPERLILSIADVVYSPGTNQASVENNLHCGSAKDIAYVYESYLRRNVGMHRIWLKTRRLVVSHIPRGGGSRCCSSFWLPLTDICFILHEADLTLRWSDCNQWGAPTIKNNRQSYDCKYDPDNLNNEAHLSFIDPQTARVFLESLCTVCNEPEHTKEWRKVEIAGKQRLLTFDIQDHGEILYRVACLSTYDSPFKITVQVFIHWPECDLDISIKNNQQEDHSIMDVRFDKVSTPNYISNVRNEPWEDESKIARCSESELVLSSYTMSFPFQPSNSSSPPKGIQKMLEHLTGWTICFFASDVELAKDKIFLDTNYGVSDVILWKRLHEGFGASKLEVRITFRHRRAKPNYAWRSGTVDVLTSPSFKLTTAEFTVTQKSHGDLLNTTSMSAVNIKGISSTSDKSTKLELQFKNSNDNTAFFKVFEELQKTIAINPSLRSSTHNTVFRLSRDLYRRHSNTSQATR